jgi:hypothetical protein
VEKRGEKAMSARNANAVSGLVSSLFLVAFVIGNSRAQAQEIPEALLKELDAVSQKQGEAFIQGVREVAGRNEKEVATLKEAFLRGRQNWRVRLTAGAVAGWIDGRPALESAFERVTEIRKTRKAQPVEKPKPESVEAPSTSGNMEDIDIKEFGPIDVVKSLPAGNTFGMHGDGHRNDWLQGLPTPIKDLTSVEARVVLLVMLASSPRPLSKTEEYRWDERSLAVALRALTGLEPDGLLDDLVLDELKKVPLLDVHRIWAFEYVAARKLQSAVPIIRDSTEAWIKAEGNNWPERAARVLAAIGGGGAEDCLINWSMREKVSFRLAAARGLSLLGTPRAKTRLHYISTDREDPIRDYAERMLEDLKSTERK